MTRNRGIHHDRRLDAGLCAGFHILGAEMASVRQQILSFAHLLGEYLGVTEGIRRRRVSIDEARAGASGNQTDVIRVVAGDAG